MNGLRIQRSLEYRFQYTNQPSHNHSSDKRIWTLVLLLQLVIGSGCVKAGPEFVEDGMRVALPAVPELTNGIHDGGSIVVTIRDAKGRRFWVHYDHGMGSPTRGAIFLSYAWDDNGLIPPKRIPVAKLAEFRSQVGDFDEHRYYDERRITLNSQVCELAVVLTWTNSSCTLQGAVSADGPYADIPGAGSPYTNSLSAQTRYFRLAANQ